jgi:ubiquinone biosynthesis monooxygenase Coq7
LVEVTEADLRAIRRILRVNHAGETGAIKIYGAQIVIAKRRYPDIVATLSKMRKDEIRHCALFRDVMKERSTRPCYVMSLWSRGGYVLGFVTALMGRNMMWICTEAVETTVHLHLMDQLRFLKSRDDALAAAIDSITEEELAHRDEARERQIGQSHIDKAMYRVISALTSTMIWLSTWGDPSFMIRDLRRS